MSTFMVPNFGFRDEARLIFRDGSEAWGAMALFRGSDDTPFDEDDIELLASPLTATGDRPGDVVVTIEEGPSGWFSG